MKKMWCCCFLALLAIHTANSAGFLDYTDIDDPYQYYWNPRNPIREQNAPCLGRSGETGVCISPAECMLYRGNHQGFCGIFGTCCTFARTCNKKTRQKVAYFKSSTSTNGCEFKVELERNTCQIRIDFEELSLAPPAFILGKGTGCYDDVLSIDSLGQSIKICGENSGQHMFIDVKGQREMGIVINAKSGRATWNIKVTQLECPAYYHKHFSQAAMDFDDLAPEGCLQYHKNRTGIIRNFGYNAVAQTGYPDGLRYAICFARPRGVCGVSLRPVRFELGGLSSESGCTIDVDYLYVPEGSQNGFPIGPALCQPLGTEEITSTPPGPLYVHFVSNNDATQNGRGFEFNYQMVNCENQQQ